MDIKGLSEMSASLQVLYAEDDTTLREASSKLFRHLFDQVTEVTNGQEAYEKIQNNHYDILITDINMPEMDGITLCQKVRAIKPTQPIIITSAHDESKYLINLIDAGVDKFILKPIDMKRLITAFGQVCVNLHNEKLLSKYKLELEAANAELKEANAKLVGLLKAQPSH